MKYFFFAFFAIITLCHLPVKCNNYIQIADHYFSIGFLDSAKKYADLAFDEINVNTPDTTKKSIYFRLFEINIELSKLDSAILYARLDSVITQQIYGIDSYQYAVCLLNISTVFVQKRDIKNANSLLDKANELLERTIGTDNEYFAQLLENRALLLMGQFNLTKAEILLQKSLELRLKHLGSEHIDYSSSLHNLATVYYFKQQYDKASELFNKSLEIKRIKLGEGHPRYANTLHNLGALYFLSGKLKESAELFQKAEASYKISLGEVSLPYAKLIANIGTMFYTKGEYNYSESLLIKALEIYDKLELRESSEYITILTNLSQLYILKGKLFNAEFLLTKLVEVQALSEDVVINKFNEEIYVESPVTSKKPSNQILLLFNDLAALYIYQGRLREARNALNFVITNYDIIYSTDSTNYTVFLTQMANVCSYMGDLDNAIYYFDSAIKILGPYGFQNSYTKFKIYTNLSSLYYSLGRYDDVIKLSKEFIELIDKDADDYNQDRLALMSNLAMAYLKNGNIDYANQVIMQLESHLSKLSDTLTFPYIIHLNNLGIFYEETKNYEKSINFFEKAIQIAINSSKTYHTCLISLFNNISSVYFRLGEFDKSLSYIEKSLDIILNNIGKDNYIYNNVEFNYALLNLLSGERSKGTELIKKSIQQSLTYINRTFSYMTESEQLKFIQSERLKLDILFSLVKEKLLVYNELNGDIFNLWVNFKGLIFASTKKMFDIIRNSNDSALIIFYDRLLEKKKMHIDQVLFNTDYNQLFFDSLSFDIFKLEKEIINKINQKTSVSFQKISWQNIAAKLGNHEAAIEIVRSDFIYKDFYLDSSFYLFMILKKNSTQPEIVIVDNAIELENYCYNLYQGIIKKKGTEENEIERALLSKLFKKYWSVINEKLNGIEKVYISNDGVYNTINLNTLFNSNSGRYIIDELNIQYISSTKDLLIEPKKLQDKKDAFLIGDPDFYISNTSDLYAESIKSEKDRYFLSSIYALPGTKVEIDKIESILSNTKWKVNKVSGKDASEDFLRSVKSPQVLHIATHGAFFRDSKKYIGSNIFSNENKSQNPLYNSCLLLAGSADFLNNRNIPPGKKEDGLLTAYEVMDMDLKNTEIVVLSACETGLGEIKNGEGVFGLQRAFQVAGADVLIMSLWKVNDTATQELMTTFYSYWMSGMKKSDAFKNAQITIKSKYPSLYFWGAFVMLGKD